MLYGKVLRPPSYGAKLDSIDLAPAKAMHDVVAVQDGAFVGVAAPTTFARREGPRRDRRDRASGSRRRTRRARSCSTTSARTPAAACRRTRSPTTSPKAAKSLQATYHVAYVQHAPMEPRAAVAEWEDGKLTVWTAHAEPVRRPRRAGPRLRPARRQASA